MTYLKLGVKKWNTNIKSIYKKQICFLVAFIYSQFKVCDQHFFILCKRLQLLVIKPDILVICIRQFLNAKANHFSFFEVI